MSKTELQATQQANAPAGGMVQASRPDTFELYRDGDKFNAVKRASQMLANAGELVPAHFRGQPEKIFVALELADRLGIAPWAMLQSIYIVKGRPGMESKALIALVNQRGPFDGPIQWREEGEEGKPGFSITAYAVHKKTGEVCEAKVDYRMVKSERWDAPVQLKAGGTMPSKWESMPGLMYRYRSAAFLARLYCPEVLLGIHSADELEDVALQPAVIFDTTPQAPAPKVEPEPEPTPAEYTERQAEPAPKAQQAPKGAEAAALAAMEHGEAGLFTDPPPPPPPAAEPPAQAAQKLGGQKSAGQEKTGGQKSNGTRQVQIQDNTADALTLDALEGRAMAAGIASEMFDEWIDSIKIDRKDKRKQGIRQLEQLAAWIEDFENAARFDND